MTGHPAPPWASQADGGVAGLVLGLVLPVRCAACGAPGPTPCPACAADLRPPPVGPVAGLDSFAAVVRYEGRGRDLVVGLKSRRRHADLGALGAALAEAAAGRAVDAVTWPPTTARRRRRRGFDQAELLARAAASHLGRPPRSTLRRLGGPQAGRAASARRAGARFLARGRLPHRLLLVDDVVTTGATLGHAAAVLRSAGVVEVHAVALARTPLKVVVAGAEDRDDGGLISTNG